MSAAETGKGQTEDAAASALARLVERFDPSVFDVGRPLVRIRVEDGEAHDVVISDGAARLDAARGDPDAILSADARTWAEIADDVRVGMAAFRRGRLRIRRDLHLGVGFLAATALAQGPGRLRLHSISTSAGNLSSIEAGTGEPVVLLHGLGATKASFLVSVGALAASHRAIAVDLPGFGDSVKPIRARYDARFFADSMVALLDALELERAHLIGNSMGGRVALEVGLQAPERVLRLALLAPSLAWLRDRPWAPLLKLVAPQPL